MARTRRHDDRRLRRAPAMLAAAAVPLLLHAAGAVASATPSASSPATAAATSVSSVTAASSVTTASSTASAPAPAPTVYNASGAAAASDGRRYAYSGCYLEISGLNGTASGSRSLSGGTDEVLPGDMTVPKCLAFCGGGGSGTAYAFAGLEYARECWCAQELSSLAAHEPDADCNLPCDGDNTTVCGGSLRLTVYALPSKTVGSAAAARPVAVLGTLLAVGVAAAGILLS